MKDPGQASRRPSDLSARRRLDTAMLTPPTMSIAHIVDATDGPLVGDETRNRVIPFALTAVLSFAISVPSTTWFRPALAVTVAAVGAVVIVAALVTPWRRVPRSAQLLVPFALLAAILLLMSAARQDVHSPFVSLLVLPLMWLALYESRLAVLAAAGLAGVALAVVQSTVTSKLPDTGTESILVLVICCAGMGITLHSLVADARSLAAALREHQVALNHLSLHDPLTDLSNRRGFSENSRIAQDRSTAENRPFSLIYIDLDHFKELNDSLGHDTGDLLLEEVADRLSGLVRSSDTVARLGGDEFAVLADGTEPLQALSLASRIDAALRQPYLAAPTFAISASVGIAHSEDVGGDPDAALSAADKSMFAHKVTREPLGLIRP
jgi:diguanylate cyclase (GGDEF)-like protein